MLPSLLPLSRLPTQVLFTCVCIIVSVTVFSYVLGEISNLVMDQDAELVATRGQVQAVQKFVANRSLPEDMRDDITRYAESSQVVHAEQGDTDIFARLSHTLQVGPQEGGGRRREERGAGGTFQVWCVL